MKNYYIAQLRIMVNGKDNSIETVSGSGFDPDIVKRKAEENIRKQNPGKIISSVFLSKEEMDLEEYTKATGGVPPWLGGPKKNE